MARPNRHKRRYKNVGRPSKITKDVLSKLEDAFTNSMSDEQACAYAGISPAALYRYQKHNEQFRERKQALKLRPDIKAKQTIVANLGDPNHAWKWLEKRDPEFSNKTKVEHVGSVDISQGTEVERSPAELKAIADLNKARLERIRENSRKMKLS